MLQTVWRTDFAAYVGVAEPCDLAADGWCRTHSTGSGPAYCAPQP